MGYITTKFEEWAVRRRVWPLSLISLIAFGLPVIQSFFSLSLRQAVRHWSFYVYSGAVIAVSGILFYVSEFIPKSQRRRKGSIYHRPTAWRVIYRNPIRFWAGLSLFAVGISLSVVGVQDYFPPTLAQDKLVVTVLSFSPVSSAALDDAENVAHRIEQSLKEKEELGAPIEIKRLHQTVDGATDREKELLAENIGKSKEGLAHIVIWGEVRKDEAQLYVRPRMTISQQLSENLIESKELEGRASMQPSHLDLKERLAKELADLTVVVYGLCYLKNRNWMRAIEILNYVQSPEGAFYRGMAFEEKSVGEINPRPDLESAVNSYEKIFPSDKPKFFTYLDIYAASHLGSTYARLARLSMPEQKLQLLRNAERFSRMASYLASQSSPGMHWVETQKNLASVLSSLGFTLVGNEAEALIKESISILNEALKSDRTLGCGCAFPLQMQKVKSLFALAEHLDGPQSASVLQEAVKVSQVEVMSLKGAERSQEYATAQLVFGQSLRRLGKQLGSQGSSGLFYLRNPVRDKQALPFFEQASVALRTALNSTSLHERPFDWVLMHIELGETLASIGAILQFGGITYFDAAVQSHKAALGVLTREANPLVWAEIQIALARVLENLASYSQSGKSELLFDEAIERREQALTVYVKNIGIDNIWARNQYELAETLTNYGLILSMSDGARHKTNAVLERAITLFDETLEVYDRVQLPVEWATAMSGIGWARSLLGKQIVGQDGNRLLREGITDIQRAQSIFTKTAYPKQWCICQNKLLEAQKTLWFRGDKEHSKWSGVGVVMCE